AKQQRGFRDWISTEGVSDYSRFLNSKGHTPDKPNGSFSERLISQLPLDISKPRFLEEHACEFIEKHRRDPFVLFVSFVEPHSPYNGPLNLEHALEDVELDATAVAPVNDNIPLRYKLMREWQQAEAVLETCLARIICLERKSCSKKQCGFPILFDCRAGARVLELFNRLVISTSCLRCSISWGSLNQINAPGKAWLRC